MTWETCSECFRSRRWNRQTSCEHLGVSKHGAFRHSPLSGENDDKPFGFYPIFSHKTGAECLVRWLRALPGCPHFVAGLGPNPSDPIAFQSQLSQVARGSHGEANGARWAFPVQLYAGGEWGSLDHPWIKYRQWALASLAEAIGPRVFCDL